MIAAVSLLEELRAIGCEVVAVDDELELARPTPLPPELIARLQRHKREIVKFLLGPPVWDDRDWLDHFHDHASHLEQTAHMPRETAQAEALQECFLRFAGLRAPRRSPLATAPRTERVVAFRPRGC